MESASVLYSVCIWKALKTKVLVKCSDLLVLHYGLSPVYYTVWQHMRSLGGTDGARGRLILWRYGRFSGKLLGFWSNIHLLQTRRLKWVPFMAPLRCCFWWKIKKGRRLMTSVPLYQWFQNKKYLNVLGILKNINSFRNFPYLKTPVGLLVPQTNHCLVLSKNCQTRS